MPGNGGWTVTDNIIWHPIPFTNFTQEGSQVGFVNACSHSSSSMTGFGLHFLTMEVAKGILRTILCLTGIYAIDSTKRYSPVYFNGAAGLTWDTSQQVNSSAYYDLLRQAKWHQPPYSTQYPSLALLYDYFEGAEKDVTRCAIDSQHCGPAPHGNSIVGVLHINSTSSPFQFADAFPASRYNIAGNFNATTVAGLGFCQADPRGTLNFQLAPSSPVLTHSAFRNIDTSTLGPYGRFRMKACSSVDN